MAKEMKKENSGIGWIEIQGQIIFQPAPSKFKCWCEVIHNQWLSGKKKIINPITKQEFIQEKKSYWQITKGAFYHAMLLWLGVQKFDKYFV